MKLNNVGYFFLMIKLNFAKKSTKVFFFFKFCDFSIWYNAIYGYRPFKDETKCPLGDRITFVGLVSSPNFNCQLQLKITDNSGMIKNTDCNLQFVYIIKNFDEIL